MQNGSNIFISHEEIVKHNNMDDCWIIINNEVFDLTNFIKYEHIGGEQLLLGNRREFTKLFLSIHTHNPNTRALKLIKDPIFRSKYFKGLLLN